MVEIKIISENKLRYLAGEKGFKPEVDLNGDGIIDIVDLAVLAYHYGENV